MIRDGIQIFKEYVISEDGKKIFFVIRTELYDNSVEYFIDLAGIAMADYPVLELKDMVAVEFGGDTHRGKRGIEFSMPNTENIIHPDYKKVSSFRLYPHK